MLKKRFNSDIYVTLMCVEAQISKNSKQKQKNINAVRHVRVGSSGQHNLLTKNKTGTSLRPVKLLILNVNHCKSEHDRVFTYILQCVSGVSRFRSGSSINKHHKLKSKKTN